MSDQRTPSLEFREFDRADYDRLMEVYNSNYPDYLTSAAEQRSRDEHIDKSKYILKRFTCRESGTGTILGFGTISHVLDVYHPRKFMIAILVDPSHHGHGVGGAIYERLSRELEDLGAEVVWAMNKEDLPRQRAFFEKRGFREKRRDWESRLHLPAFEPEKFRAYSARVAEQGIRFTTLARESARGSDSLRKLHELVQHIAEDMPRQADYTPIPFEQWKALELNSPRLLPEGYLIAKEGSRFVGLSVVYKNNDQPGRLTQGDTGVRREYRGRGIATALKLKIIEYARKNGYRDIETWNDSSNAPMLAVNTKLGFKRHVGWILLEKILNRLETA